MTAPDVAGRVIAFRSWRLSRERLVSPFIPCRWDGRVMHAACADANRTLTLGRGWLDEPHPSPHPDCQCGIYGYHRAGPRSWFGEVLWCEGAISAWGRLVVHADGFRAERARVELLALPEEPHGAAAVRAAARHLAVEVVRHDELEAAAHALGGGIPATLLP